MGSNVFLFEFLAVFLLIIVVDLFVRVSLYKKTSYYKVTKVPYFKLMFDKGKKGEYLVYRKLKKFEKVGWQFLFNLYIPKKNGSTSEIDLLLITPKGLFVIESKNYDGWIFGRENNINWTQVLPTGNGTSCKQRFYNPIKQNQSHIKYLTDYIGNAFTLYSVIVFSDKCEFKNVTVSEDCHLVYRRHVMYKVKEIYSESNSHFLSVNEMGEIYQALYPLSQVCLLTKDKHNRSIDSKM